MTSRAARPKTITRVLKAIYPLHDDVVAKAFLKKGLYERALKLLPNEWKRLVDIGCGTGRTLESIEENKLVIGLDLTLEFLKLAKSRHVKRPVDFVYGTATHLPFRSNSFDGALTYTMMHHLTTDEKVRALREIARVSEVYVFGEVGKKLCWSSVLLKLIGSKGLISKELISKAGLRLEVWEDPRSFCLVIGRASRLRKGRQRNTVGGEK